MAEVQVSGPLTDDNLTDDQWMAIFGSNAGIVGDTDGSAYGITLPPSSDTVQIGSATIDSRAVVGGYGHAIPEGTTQSLEIPASTNPTVGRTDLIVARYSSAFTTAPGPVRLHRIAGTEGSAALPSHTTTLPSPVDLVLYAITRKQGEALNQAVVVDRRSRAGWHYIVPTGSALPQSAPLGARATRGGTVWRRDFVESSVDWVVESEPPTRLTGTAFTSGAAFPGWSQDSTQRLVLDGTMLWVHVEVTKSGGQIVATSTGSLGDNQELVTLNSAWKPPVPVSCSAYVTSDGGVERNAGARINTAGVVQVTSTQPGASVRKVTVDACYSLATA